MSLCFIQISDTHLGPTKDFALEGAHVFERVWAVVEAIQALPFRPDFILHSGDVAHRSEFGEQGAYKIARDLFAEFDVPLYYVPGNHDDQDAMRRLLHHPDVEWLQTPQGRLDYRFTAGEMNILALDARLGDVAEGELLEEQFTHLRSIADAGKDFVLFLHYLAFDLGVPWYLSFTSPDGPDRMLLKNGERLHTALVKAQKFCRGVFFGHLHCARTILRDGVFYSTAPSASMQIDGWPSSPKPTFRPDLAAGYQVVRIGEFGTTVSQHWVQV